MPRALLVAAAMAAIAGAIGCVDLDNLTCGYACTGGATVDANSTDANEGGTDGGAPPPVDGGPSWCSTQDATDLVLCDDFDEMSTINTTIWPTSMQDAVGNDKVEIDKTFYVTPPYSLHVSTPASSTLCSAHAGVEANFIAPSVPSGYTHVTYAFDYYVSPLIGLVGGIWINENWYLALGLGPDSNGDSYVQEIGDTSDSFLSHVPTGHWVRVQLDADLDPGSGPPYTGTLKVSLEIPVGQPATVVNTKTINSGNSVSAGPFDSLLIELGDECAGTAGASDLYYDNVTLYVR